MPDVEQTKDLSELRTSCGLTQEGLGSQVVVSRFENGHRKPGANAIARMARRLGVTTQVVYAACQESMRRANLRREQQRQAAKAKRSRKAG